MNPKHIYIGLAVFAVVLVGNSYLGSVRDTAKAEQVKTDVQKQIADLRTDLKSTLDAIQKDREQVKTSAQVAQAVPRYTPDVRPILIVPNGVPTNTSDVGGNIPSVSLPDAPSSITAGSLIIPNEQVPAYWRSVTACAEDHANLGACQKELPLVQQERDAWKKAAKGSFWHKTVTALKWTAVGIGIGAGVAYVTH